MHWRPATRDDATLLADLAAATSGDPVSPAEAATFLSAWSVELAVSSSAVPDRADRPALDGAGVVAAVAVLPPASGHHRGHGAWWSRQGADAEVIGRLTELATSTPGVRILQVSTQDPRALLSHGFVEAYPVWTMVHDNITWPASVPALPAPLRSADWSEVPTESLWRTYDQAYRDQRLVEPHTSESLNELVSDATFAADLSTFATAPDGGVAGFVVAFVNDRGEVELGPIVTMPAWRGRGVASALLASTLARCHGRRPASITLTVDAESPTGAHYLYLRYGFRITARLVAYHLAIPDRA